jgi:hypothetical protein
MLRELSLSLAAAVAIFRFKIGMIPTLAAAAPPASRCLPWEPFDGLGSQNNKRQRQKPSPLLAAPAQ